MNTNVLDFGAVGDGVTLCTAQICAAIDACAASGGGRVSVPAGTYLTGTVWLRDHVELHLEHGAVLKGSRNMEDYNALDAYVQNFSSPVNEKWLGKHLILAVECTDIALTGSGTVDGSGDAFFDGIPKPYSVHVWREGLQDVRDERVLRPGQLLAFVECTHVRVEGVTLTNQPCWGCFLHGCEYVTVRGLKTRNPHSFFNSDGIDIDCCRYVTVSDCSFDTGDDCIAIRGASKWLKRKPAACEFITISNCVLGSCSSAIRIGVGDSVIRHVRISNIVITRGAPAINIQSSYHGNGRVSVQDVGISHVSVAHCARPFEISEGAGVPVRNILLEDFHVVTDGHFALCCDHPDSVSDIVLRDFEVTLEMPPVAILQKDIERRGTVWFRANRIDGLRLENFRVNDPHGYLDAWRDGVFDFADCENLCLHNVSVNGEAYIAKQT